MIVNNKILYWPGRGQDLKILRHFREKLEYNGYNFENINIEYDKDSLTPYKWKQIAENKADWWIGISLGASLLYYSLQYVKDENKPSRITLINPFFSRRILSKEKNFNMKNQWDFDPINCKCKIENIDMVLSVYDNKIPMYHGIKLLNNTNSNNKKIIFIDEGHIIENEAAQAELGKALINISNPKGGLNEKYNYCNIYK